MSPTPEIVRITHPEHGPVFEFDRPLSQGEASRALFGADGPPPGVTVRAGDSPDEWQVQGLNAGNVGELTGNLPAIVASSSEVVPRDEYDSERAARESANDAAMNEPLQELGKTAKEMFDGYGPGHHQVNGNFVWIGIKDGEKTIQWHPRTDNETFNKDMEWYLDHGLSLADAIHKFDQQWNEITAQILRAFGGTLASAGGAGVPVKPPFTMTQALTLGVDALKTKKTSGDGAYEPVPMPSDDRPQQHDKDSTGEAGTDRDAPPERPAAPEAEEEQECRPEPETPAAPEAESKECRPEAEASPPEAEVEECRPEAEASAPPEAGPASHHTGDGDDLGVKLGLGPGVTPEDLTPAAFSFGSHTGVAGNLVEHGDDSGAGGLFDDAGAGVGPIGPDGGPGLPSAEPDGSAFGDPGAGFDGRGFDGGVYGDPGGVSDGGPLGLDGSGGGGFRDAGAGLDEGVLAPHGPDGGVFGDPGAGLDGGVLAPHGSDGGVFGDPGAGLDGGVLAPHGPDGGVFGDPSAGCEGGLLAPHGPDGGVFGDPRAGYGGGLLAPHESDGGVFGDPGAGHDAGICGADGGWADSASFGPGGQSAIGPAPDGAAFSGDPGQAFGLGSVGGEAAGGGASSGAM